MSYIQLLILSVICNVTANILLKFGVTKAGGFTLSPNTLTADLIKTALNPYIMGGLALYGFSFIVWLRVLTISDLSKSYPIFVTIVFILTTVGSVIFLKESVSAVRLIGIAILIAGVFLVARS
jgi:multidrug transporter EmrE-like cation transporter